MLPFCRFILIWIIKSVIYFPFNSSVVFIPDIQVRSWLPKDNLADCSYVYYITCECSFPYTGLLKQSSFILKKTWGISKYLRDRFKSQHLIRIHGVLNACFIMIKLKLYLFHCFHRMLIFRGFLNLINNNFLANMILPPFSSAWKPLFSKKF